MPALPDPTKLIDDMKAAVTAITSKDFPALTTFAKRQMKALADQAVWIAHAQLNGDFTPRPQLRDHFLKQLDRMTQNFARVLVALVALTIEKIWNALVGVLWTAIGKAIGVTLPLPRP
jgi:hypothetical protein